jgi:hypothetical protein
MLSLLLSSRSALAGLGTALVVAFAPLSDTSTVATGSPQATVTVDAGSTTPTLVALGGALAWASADGTADIQTGALRPAMVKAVASLGVRSLRFPSGLFANCYDWRLGVGPLGRRAYNWTNFNSPSCHYWNQGQGFGTDEFMAEVAQVSALEHRTVEPIITVNICSMQPGGTCGGPHGYPQLCPDPTSADLATGCPGAVIAAHWVQYLNGAASTPMGAYRARFGHPAPYGVHWFELGNETRTEDSPQRPRYTRIVLAYARAMKAADPSIGIVAQGPCVCPDPPADMSWESYLLSTAGSEISAIAPHIYHNGGDATGVVDGYLARLQATIAAAGLSDRVRIMPTEWAASDTSSAPVDDLQRWGDMRAALNDATDWLAFVRHGVADAPFFSIHGGPYAMLHCSIDNPLDQPDRCATPEVEPYPSIPARALRMLAQQTGGSTMATSVSGPVEAAATGDAGTLHVDLVNTASSPLTIAVDTLGTAPHGTATLVGMSGSAAAEDLARTPAAYPTAAFTVLPRTLATMPAQSRMTVTLPARTIAVLTMPVAAPVGGAAAASTTTAAWPHWYWRIRLS